MDETIPLPNVNYEDMTMVLEYCHARTAADKGEMTEEEMASFERFFELANTPQVISVLQVRGGCWCALTVRWLLVRPDCAVAVGAP